MCDVKIALKINCSTITFSTKNWAYLFRIFLALLIFKRLLSFAFDKFLGLHVLGATLIGKIVKAGVG